MDLGTITEGLSFVSWKSKKERRKRAAQEKKINKIMAENFLNFSRHKSTN